MILIVLAVFVAGLFPLPMYLPSGSGSDNLPYPCQGGACGCGSAEKCWTNCCCSTPAERLVWAQEHNVTLPEDVFLALANAAPKGDHDEQLDHEHHDHEEHLCSEDHQRAPRHNHGGAGDQPTVMTKSASLPSLTVNDPTTEGGCTRPPQRIVSAGHKKTHTHAATTNVAGKGFKRIWVDSLSASRCKGHRYDLGGGSCFDVPSFPEWTEETSLTEVLVSWQLRLRSNVCEMEPPPPRALS